MVRRALLKPDWVRCRSQRVSPLDMRTASARRLKWVATHNRHHRGSHVVDQSIDVIATRGAR